jgi:hypothetical protein
MSFKAQGQGQFKVLAVHTVVLCMYEDEKYILIMCQVTANYINYVV